METVGDPLPATAPARRKKFLGKVCLAPSEHSRIGFGRSFRAAAPVLADRLKRAAKQHGVPLREHRNRDLVTRAVKRQCVLTCRERILADERLSCRITVKIGQTVFADLLTVTGGGNDDIEYRRITWKSGHWQRYISALFPDLHPGGGLSQN